ncbi:MAG: type II toxin-antitoxin system HicB family antitoxin, partial [Bacteroidota bacterium]
MKKPANKTIHLPILLETDEDNYFIVSCPVFKGCHSYGKTIDEAMKNIREVIEMCLEENVQAQPLNNFLGYREIEISLPP